MEQWYGVSCNVPGFVEIAALASPGLAVRPKGTRSMVKNSALGAASFVVLLACSGPVSAGVFKSPVLYTVGSEPQVVVAADFRGIGTLDLASADFSSNDVSILLGNGDGTFQAAKQFTTTDGPQALAIGDFNGDGKLDIAVAEYGFGSALLEIYLGNGDGTFTPGASYTNVSLPYDIATADLDGDGKLDLVIANNGSNTVSVMHGNGDGTFANPHDYTVQEPERVLIFDANGDGHPDIAALAYCGKNVQICKYGAVAMLLNNGHGKFSKPKYYSVRGTGPDGVAAADLSNNGKLDLVVANNNFQAPSVISVMPGNGDGTFGRPHLINVGSGPAGVASADFTGDGNADIAVANTASATATLLLGKGNGKFKAPQSIQFNSGSLPISATAADFNKDGAPDLAVALSYANEIAVLINKR